MCWEEKRQSGSPSTILIASCLPLNNLAELYDAEGRYGEPNHFRKRRCSRGARRWDERSGAAGGGVARIHGEPGARAAPTRAHGPKRRETMPQRVPDAARRPAPRNHAQADAGRRAGRESQSRRIRSPSLVPSFRRAFLHPFLFDAGGLSNQTGSISRKGDLLLWQSSLADEKSSQKLGGSGAGNHADRCVQSLVRSHCTPEQAVQMANEAGAHFIMPVHHQTFRLSVEGFREPIERFEAALHKTPERVALREIGETFVLP
jgi:hypothetical protein